MCDASDPIHFRGTLERLIHIACLSPSVGLSQPWRFVIVDDPARRRAIAEVFEACNAEALSSFARALVTPMVDLKLAGIKERPLNGPSSRIVNQH